MTRPIAWSTSAFCAGDVRAGGLIVVHPYRPPQVVERARERVLLGRVEIEIERCDQRSDEAIIDRRERPEAPPGEPFEERVAFIRTDHCRRQDVGTVVVHLQEERPIPVSVGDVVDGTVAEMLDDVLTGHALNRPVREHLVVVEIGGVPFRERDPVIEAVAGLPVVAEVPLADHRRRVPALTQRVRKGAELAGHVVVVGLG